MIRLQVWIEWRWFVEWQSNELKRNISRLMWPFSYTCSVQTDRQWDRQSWCEMDRQNKKGRGKRIRGGESIGMVRNGGENGVTIYVWNNLFQFKFSANSDWKSSSATFHSDVRIIIVQYQKEGTYVGLGTVLANVHSQ